MFENITASTKLPDVLRASSSGEQVNIHVVEFVKEPEPDFERMNDAILGRSSRSEAKEGSSGRQTRSVPEE